MAATSRRRSSPSAVPPSGPTATGSSLPPTPVPSLLVPSSAAPPTALTPPATEALARARAAARRVRSQRGAAPEGAAPSGATLLASAPAGPPATATPVDPAPAPTAAPPVAGTPGGPATLEAMPDVNVAALLKESERLVADGVTDSAGTFVRYLHDLRRYALLSPDQEYRLARLAQAGNREAQEALVRHNLRFVITLAKKYASSNVLFEDLVQEGNLGLMRAVTKFDPDRGVKLVSYAAYWIEQSIRSALVNQQRAVRLPANRAAELSRVRRAVATLRLRQDRVPTAAEVARETALPEATVEMLLSIGGDVPLDAPVRENGNGSEGTWTDRLVAEGATDDALETESRAQAIAQLLVTLKSRDATVLRLCFGLNYAREHTLEEVGLILGISRERARQIRDRALRDIQASSNVHLLADFWDTRRPSDEAA